MARPYRSVLYIPAANARAMEKAQGLPADAIIFDLEDAVSPGEKLVARDALKVALNADYGPRARIVRINALDSAWGQDDARFCAGLGDRADAVLIPKVDSAADLDKVAALVPDTPLWAMMETPLGMLNAAGIAAHPRLAGMVMGTNDLAKELNTRFRADRVPMLAGLSVTARPTRYAWPLDPNFSLTSMEVYTFCFKLLTMFTRSSVGSIWANRASFFSPLISTSPVDRAKTSP